MSTHPVLQSVRFTMSEYLTFERAAEERHEYLDGMIYAMAGESLAHGTICTNLTMTLATQLRGTPCRVFSKDIKVQVGPYRASSRQGLYAYPDLLVICGEPQVHDAVQDVILNPRVIIEVLSPSTSTFDRNDKCDRYRQWLPSLTDYLLVWQDRPKINHCHRTAPQCWALRTIEGLNEVLRLPEVGCTMPVTGGPLAPGLQQAGGLMPDKRDIGQLCVDTARHGGSPCARWMG
ncbi:MAG: Uma2 family endonuclease [Candidatus Tectomicrobia bacterium]|uniref:Uma2 family endonuclease n=1 Tax=Tectimicrobiota bacterium TaxID=2528274 RepID=A0A937VX87_UNCTE|nr:Uma2 family endonuclease [Candidatus Tectomicrobia bacterium]